MALSMIVEITSLIPRVTFSTPAIPAHAAPTVIATNRMKSTWIRGGQVGRAADVGGEERGQQVLPLDTDVEQVHPEPDRGGDAGDVERRGPVEDVDRASRACVPCLIMSPNTSTGLLPAPMSRSDDDRRSRTRQPSPERRSASRNDRSRLCCMRTSPTAAPVMYDAEIARRDRRGVEAWRRCRPRNMTRIVSDRPISSSRSAEISNVAKPGGAGVAELIPHGCLGPDVDAAGRVGGDQHLRVRGHLAPDDQLLLVATRQRVRGDVDVGRARRRTPRRSPRCARGCRRGRSTTRWRTARWV